MIERNDIRLLAQKWMEGTISDKEKATLNEWYESEYEATINWESDKSKEDLKKRLFQSILEQIHIGGEEQTNGKTHVVSIRRRWYKFAVAAAIVVAVLTGGYFFYNNTRSNNNPHLPVAVKEDIPPGSDKAILTLADGRQIVLNDVENGAIADEGNVKVNKLDGKVSYSVNGTSDKVVYNTISTPRTGQYQLVLADGTKVWLDAESSIRFPNFFQGSERRVELKGQGYFEVAHNTKMPFHVSVPSPIGGGRERAMDVQVLGTHFNIMAYGNEDAVKTTLLEGKVKVTSGAGTAILKPGYQAQLRKDHSLKTITNVNPDQTVAWKNGMFQLEGTSMREVFRQIERWYDVDVIVQGNFNDESLSGVFSKKQYVSQLLKILEEAGVGYFRMEGKKIYVTKS